MKLRPPRPVPAGRTPHVEVVVPCHDYGRYLTDCVRSVVEQPGVVATVTIVDDASTDGSAEVAERLAETTPRVRLLRNPTNLGAVATFNRGLAAADSDYVLLLSADDLLTPGALQRAVAVMEAHPRVGLVYGHARAFRGSPPPWRARPVTWSTWRGEEWVRAQVRRGWSPISSPEAVVRTGVQHAVGYYDPTLPFTHDLQMWLRIAAVADVARVNGVDQACYRVHDANMSARAGVGVAADVGHRFEAYRSFLAEAPEGLDAEALDRVLVRRASDEVVALALDAALAGRAGEAELDEALRLARGIDPDVTRRHAWRDLAALRASPGVGPGAGARIRSTGREAADRWRWWRWRLVGL